jgi:hypothetical protein
MVDLKIYITGRRRRKMKERQLLAVRFSNNFQSVGTVKGYCQTKRSVGLILSNVFRGRKRAAFEKAAPWG